MYNWQDDSLFVKPEETTIAVQKSHELVKLTDSLPWHEMISIAMKRRETVKKSLTGPEPRYRQLLGAIALMAVKGVNFREAEDLIRNYVPARYLCDLLDSPMEIDHVSIFEFSQMIGPEGMEALNRPILARATELGLCDPTHLMSDTTAQEARIPYPNEAGLMSRFMTIVGRAAGKLRGKFDGVKSDIKEATEKVKGLLRNAHLFAKGRDQKKKIEKKMYHTVKSVQSQLAKLISSGANVKSKAGQELVKITGVMEKLLPQIKHFLDTSFVASGKVIHLQIPELYAIVRGKAGKTVEFGLKWGISRMRGGFLHAFLMNCGEHRSDPAFCSQAVHEHIALFGKAPRVFGFDRGGDSATNIKRAKKLGVKHVGIAPKGQKAWSTSERMTNRIRRERAQVEGSIGTIKSTRYGFNRPNAHSKAAMARCGHKAILGFNMRKMVIMQAMAAAN
jgi:hypothetical protein